MKNNIMTKNTQRLITNIKKNIITVYKNDTFKNMLILTGKCWCVYSISILAVIRSNFQYIDDLGRTYSGNVSDWDVYNRYFAEVLCKFFSGGNIVVDASPLSQILTMLCMAIAVSIIVLIIAPEHLSSNWLVAATIPFAISPYFMENISYKIECIIHGWSVLLSVFPLLFYKRKGMIYGTITAVCIILMCITYQGASGVFPCVVVMVSVVMWNNGEEMKSVIKFLCASAIGYLSGLFIFKFLIMNPVSTHVSSEILPFKDMIPGIFYNLVTFYKVIVQDFKISWKIIILLVSIVYICVYSATSKRKTVPSVFMAVFSVIMMGALCFGIYPVLKECVYHPRNMYEVCLVVAMLCIFIASRGYFISKAAVLSLAWCFIVFAFEYGNCLDLQQEYTNVRTQAVVDYLNERCDSDIQYTLELNGYIGQAPAIQNQTKDNALLNKLIPKTLGGGWCWAEYKLYRYYGLPSNYSVVWAWDRKRPEIDLLQKDLPLTDRLMWFDVYSKDGQILIQMKS